jgi:hypothetical protein
LRPTTHTQTDTCTSSGVLFPKQNDEHSEKTHTDTIVRRNGHGSATLGCNADADGNVRTVFRFPAPCAALAPDKVEHRAVRACPLGRLWRLQAKTALECVHLLRRRLPLAADAETRRRRIGQEARTADPQRVRRLPAGTVAGRLTAAIRRDPSSTSLSYRGGVDAVDDRKHAERSVAADERLVHF